MMTLKAVDPKTVTCPVCWASVGIRCYATTNNGIHKARRKLARDDANRELIEAARAEALAHTCQCRNHLGRPKTKHKNCAVAVKWMTKQAKRGMRLEVYRCPREDVWHVRTAKVSR